MRMSETSIRLPLYHTWLSPMAVVTIAEPKPVVTDTLMPPIMLHTIMYHSMVFLPYLEAERKSRLGQSWQGRCSPGRKVENDNECGDDEN